MSKTDLNEQTKIFYNSSKAKGYIKRSSQIKYDDQLLEEIILNIPQDGKFLDAGCGTGNFLQQLIAKSQEQKRSDIKFMLLIFQNKWWMSADQETKAL